MGDRQGCNIQIDERFGELLRANGLVDFDAFFADSLGVALTKPGLDDWRDRRRLCLTAATDAQSASNVTAYLKRFHSPPILAQLRRIVFRKASRSTGWWEWQAIRRLQAAGVPSVGAIAFGHEMQGWWERRSFLLVEAASGEALERWLPRGWPTLSPRQRRIWIERLAALVASLHSAGLCHRDLYLSHVFVDAADPDAPRFCLIDLQRVFSPRRRVRRWQIKDLAQLGYSSLGGAITQAERWRFLRAYLRRTDKSNLSEWARAIDRKVRRIARHDVHRQRRLGIQAAANVRQPVQEP
jgi:hypothetical protein